MSHANAPQPLIHPLYDPTTKIWQYLVADPYSRHAVVIDTVLLPNNSSLISTQPADNILALIRQQTYRVEWILETAELTPASQHRSAAYYLRMQLLEIQGFAPRICSPNRAVANFKNFFARKYASLLATNFDDTQPKDGEPIPVGQMYVIPMALPGLGSINGRGYIVANNVFGAYSLVHIKQAMQEEDFGQKVGLGSMSETHCHDLWTSVQKVLGMPFDFRIWFDRGAGFTSGKGRSVRFEGERRSAESEPFATVVECRKANEDLAKVGEEFMAKWTEAKYQRDKAVASTAADSKKKSK